MHPNISYKISIYVYFINEWRFSAYHQELFIEKKFNHKMKVKINGMCGSKTNRKIDKFLIIVWNIRNIFNKIKIFLKDPCCVYALLSDCNKFFNEHHLRCRWVFSLDQLNWNQFWEDDTWIFYYILLRRRKKLFNSKRCKVIR